MGASAARCDLPLYLRWRGWDTGVASHRAFRPLWCHLAMHSLVKGLGESLAIDLVVLPCALDALEGQLWDRHTCI